MDKLICFECQTAFDAEENLHRHIRVHKLKMSEYYHKHFPRYDKLTGEPIKFKDKESYFFNDFNNKANLKLWLQKVTPEEARVYIRSYFFARKQRKNLRFAPTQVELRTLPIPGMKYLSDLFGSYKSLCDSVGLELRHKRAKFSTSRNISKYKVFVDTREQQPLAFNLPSEVKTLHFADYRLSDDSVTCNCVIERKAVDDFYGTLGRNLSRFKRELEKSRDAGAYVVVVVEGSFQSVYDFRNRSFFNKPLRESEQRDEKPIVSSPEHVFHGMRNVMEEFNNVQFLFVADRKEAVRVIEKIFASNCEYKEVDLQYAYDIGEL
jgi:ERCC4-type nuclease